MATQQTDPTAKGEQTSEWKGFKWVLLTMPAIIAALTALQHANLFPANGLGYAVVGAMISIAVAFQSYAKSRATVKASALQAQATSALVAANPPQPPQS